MMIYLRRISYCVWLGVSFSCLTAWPAQEGTIVVSVHLADLSPPVINAIADVNVSDGASYSVTPSLSQGSGTITWSITLPATPPGDMAINSFSGQVTWTADFAFSPVNITIQASGPGGTDTESWIITIPPPPIWVDFDFMDMELGTFARPFRTLGVAISASVTGDTINIKGDSAVPFTLETLLINKAVRLEAIGGPVRIGGSFAGSARDVNQTSTGFVSRSRAKDE